MQTLKKRIWLFSTCFVVFAIIAILLLFYMVTDRFMDLSQGHGLWLGVCECALCVTVIIIRIICANIQVRIEMDALEAKCNKEKMQHIYTNMLIGVVFELLFLFVIIFLGVYAIRHRLYIEELLKWVGIMVVIASGCFLCFLVNFSRRRKITKKRNKYNFLLASIIGIIAFLSILILMLLAENEANNIFFHKVVEFIEENGPYVENPYLK